VHIILPMRHCSLLIRTLLSAAFVLVLAQGCGGIKVTTNAPNVAAGSTLSSQKISQVAVSMDDALDADKQQVIGEYDVSGHLQRAVTESLQKGSHVDAGGIPVNVTITGFRLRNPMNVGLATGPDVIEVTVEVGGKTFQTDAGLLTGSSSREGRLSKLLTELTQKIVDGL